MKKKLIIRLLIFLTVLAAALFFAYYLLRPVADDGSQGSYLMGDFTCNGKEELLIASQVFNEPRTHIIKLIDIETKDIIWKYSYAHGYKTSLIFEPCLSDSIIILKDSFHIEDTVSGEQFGNIDLLGINGKTGELLWKRPILDSLQYYMHTELFGNNKDIYLCVEGKDINDKTAYMLKINPQNGEPLWETTIPYEYDFEPKFMENEKILFNDYRKLFCINNKTGETSILNDEEYYLNAFSANDKEFYFITFKNIYRFDTVKHFVKQYQNIRTGEERRVLDFDDYALSKDKLICFNNRNFDTLAPKYSIQVIPFDSTKGYEYYIEDGYIAETRFLEANSRLMESVSNQNVITSRYIPIQLKRIDRSTLHKPDSIDLDISKIIIFDLDNGKAVWESKEIKDLFLLNYATSNGHYYLAYQFPYKDTVERVKLSVNGKTGNYHKAVSFNEIPLAYLSQFDEQKFTGKHIYFSNFHITWCLSFPELELKYATEDLNVKDAKENLEEVWGEMPWSGNN